jgi:DNA-binding CsgD family transcriptional regulator
MMAMAPFGGGTAIEKASDEEGGMAALESISDLVGAIYEASMDAAHWPAVLDRIAAQFHASFVGLAIEDMLLGKDAARYYTNTQIDQRHVAAYISDYTSNKDDNDIYKFLPMLPVCRTVRRSVLQSDAEFIDTDMYRYWLRRVDIHHMTITNLIFDARAFVFLNVSRDKTRNDFSPDETRVLEHLAPHLQRAFQIQQRLAVADAERGALDTLPWGVVFVDAAGRVLSHNRAAAEILAEQDGLALRRERLVTAAPAKTAQLDAAIRQAALSANGAAPPPDPLPLSRPSLRRPLLVVVAPASRSTPSSNPRPAAAVFITDPERRIEPQATVLRRLYGLTAAEAGLALAMLQGEGLGAAAERLGIRLSTAKTQLASVFAKTDTRRQAELVHLVLSGPAGLRLD